MKRILVALAVLIWVYAAGPASAFKLGFTAGQEVPVSTASVLLEERPYGGLYHLWMQPYPHGHGPGEHYPADSFYKLCAWAHGVPYQENQAPNDWVRGCIKRQINLPENTWIFDADEIYPEYWYRIALTFDELCNLLARIERATVPLQPPPAAPTDSDILDALSVSIQELKERIRELGTALNQSAVQDSPPPQALNELEVDTLRTDVDALAERVSTVEDAQKEAHAERAKLRQELESRSVSVPDAPPLPSTQEISNFFKWFGELVAKYWLVLAMIILVASLIFLLPRRKERDTQERTDTREHTPAPVQATSQTPSEKKADPPKGSRLISVRDKQGKEHSVAFEPAADALDGSRRFINPNTGNPVKEDGLIKYAKDFLRERKNVDI